MRMPSALLGNPNAYSSPYVLSITGSSFVQAALSTRIERNRYIAIFLSFMIIFFALETEGKTAGDCPENRVTGYPGTQGFRVEVFDRGYHKHVACPYMQP